jgi:hypothetical protein
MSIFSQPSKQVVEPRGRARSSGSLTSLGWITSGNLRSERMLSHGINTL